MEKKSQLHSVIKLTINGDDLTAELKVQPLVEIANLLSDEQLKEIATLLKEVKGKLCNGATPISLIPEGNKLFSILKK